MRLPITAVVCARNRSSSIAACLSALRAAGPTRIIVVDGDSTDGTSDVARATGADVISDGGAGLGAARALGAEAANTEWVAYIDSDTIIQQDTLSALLAVAVADGLDGVQAALLSSTEHPSYWQRGEIARRRLQERPGRASVMGCQATLIRRRLLADVPFDPIFNGAAEDHDWCFRAQAAGSRLAHTDQAVAFHEDRRTFGEFIRQRLWYGHGMARLLIRHRRLAPQLRSASAGMGRSPGLAPFLLVSWIATAAGIFLEMTSLIVKRRDVLNVLRGPYPSTHRGRE